MAVLNAARTYGNTLTHGVSSRIISQVEPFLCDQLPRPVGTMARFAVDARKQHRFRRSETVKIRGYRSAYELNGFIETCRWREEHTGALGNILPA